MPTSKYLGVRWYTAYQAWAARVTAHGTPYHVGYFDEERRAALQRDKLALAALGPEARLNFHPRTGENVHGRRARDLGLRVRAKSARDVESVIEQTKRFRRKRTVARRTGIAAFYGVHAVENGKRFAASVDRPGTGRGVRAGTWPSAPEAALARDRLVLHFGLELPLNFTEKARAAGPASAIELRALALSRRKGIRGQPAYIGVTSARADGQHRTKRATRAERSEAGYHAQFSREGRTYTLGRFATAEEAAVWHDRAAVYHDGANAKRNFPDRHVKPASIAALRRECIAARRALGTTRGLRASRYRGVVFVDDKWAAAVTVGKKRYARAGTWRTERAAALAHDRAVLHYGRGTPLNFPAASRKLGPASPTELRREAQAANRAGRTLSRYIGVNRAGKRWRAQLRVDGVSHVLGYFSTAKDAAQCRERAVVYYNSGAALRNFPRARVSPASIADLQRENARWRKSEDGASSEYFGVTYSRNAPSDRPWLAELVSGESLGFWEAETDAAEAHDRAALYYKVPSRFLNFPERARSLDPADAETLRVEARQRYFKSRTSSRFRGVTWDTSRRQWRAAIRHQNRTTKLGYFNDERAAARAYDRRSRALRGRRAWLNFDPYTGAEIRGKRVGLPNGRAGTKRS